MSRINALLPSYTKHEKTQTERKTIMKKKTSRVASLALALLLIVNMIAASASAANYTTNYQQYSAPSSSDFAYWNGSRVVRASGTTISEVKWMQAALNYCIVYKGLNATKLDVDGSFGPASKATALAFQRTYGLEQDGSFGPSTIQKMKTVLNDNGSSDYTYRLCWPVSSSVYGYKTITSSLGARSAPVAGASVNHKGIDIGIPTGSKILSTADGQVMFVGSNSARGKYVVIYHQSIGLTSVYQHLSSYSVKAGQYVSKGQEIARSGNTGNSSGPHLHFELVLTSSAPSSVDCAWFTGVKLLDGHYNNSLIKYEYRK